MFLCALVCLFICLAVFAFLNNDANDVTVITSAVDVNIILDEVYNRSFLVAEDNEGKSKLAFVANLNLKQTKCYNYSLMLKVSGNVVVSFNYI